MQYSKRMQLYMLTLYEPNTAGYLFFAVYINEIQFMTASHPQTPILNGLDSTVWPSMFIIVYIIDPYDPSTSNAIFSY